MSTSLRCVSGFVSHVPVTFSRFLISFKTSPDYLFQYFDKAGKNIRKANYEILSNVREY